MPGTCYVQFPGAAVSCRDPWPRDGSALRLGQRWEIYIPMGSFPECSLLQPLCCTVLRRPRTKPGGAFLQLQSKRFLSKSSVPILLFLLTVLKLCFFGTREASLLKKRDLTVEQIVPHTWGSGCSFEVTADVIWFGGYYFGDCSVLELCNHMEAAFDLLAYN